MPIKVHLPNGDVVNFPDGMAQADIEKALAEHHGAVPKRPTSMFDMVNPLEKMTRPSLGSVVDKTTDLLPFAGGVAGGALGAVGGVPGAIGGAALGGAAGEAGKQLVNRIRGRMVPSSAGEAATDIGIAGATQGALEGGGRAISGTLRAVAPRIYQGLLKPTLAARSEHPNLVKTGLENAIPISESGAEKAGALVGQSMDKANALVADRAAAPNAPTIDPRNAVAGIVPAIKAVKDLPVARPQLRAIGDYARQYMAEHPSAMALPDAQRAVRATDKFFDASYRATMDRGNPITSGNTAAALGINNETRGLLRDAVPGLREQNAVTSDLAGVRDAVSRRVGAQGNLSPVGMQHLINAGLGGGAGLYGGKEKGIGTFLAMEALTNPMTGSHIAIGANRTASIQWEQALRAALMAKLLGEEHQPGGNK